MEKEETLLVVEAVIKTLPNAMLRTALKNGHRVLAHVSGKMHIDFMRILFGDKV